MPSLALIFLLCSLVQRAAAGSAAGGEHLARGLLVERPFEQHDARFADQPAQAAAEVARKEMRRPDESE